MRTADNEGDFPAGRMKRGRAVVVGLGLDDSGGHIRYTKGKGFELYGGSECAHTEMQRRAKLIQDEIDRMGIVMERMTREQYQMVQNIVERVNCK